jgi:Mating-type protein beta 1
MSNSLKDRFAAAEGTFLKSIVEGPTGMESFDRSWSALLATFENAIEKEYVDEETHTIAHQVSTRIEIMAGQFLALHEATNGVASSLQSDLDTIFATLNINELAFVSTSKSNVFVRLM